MPLVERDSVDYRHAPGLRRSSNFRLLVLIVLSAVVGVVAGVVAWGLYALIGLLTNLVFFQRFGLDLPPLLDHRLGWWILVVPALGGLAVGLMARYGSPKIRGHGIPEAMEAVLTQRSRIQPRVAILKPISAAIAIGTGGPFGAEGPIIQTGGALGSVLGQLLRTTAAERKTLLACGAAAGMAATFSTPIAAVILAIELLLFEFKARSFIPLVVASTLATTVRTTLMGPGPMFAVGAMDFRMPDALPHYIVLGLLCGLAAVAFSNALYVVEDLFERLPFDSTWWPALGGLGLGVIGYFVPRVLGVGYETITEILTGTLPLALLLVVLVFKTLALLVSLGAGTSGGLLAPMFMAGAALGGAFALVTNAVLPAAELSPGACALVGMAAVFGAASRATFTFIIFAFELTRDYDAILPLMLVCVLADAVGLILMRNSIMTEKLARRGLKVHQEYEVDVLHQVTVGEVMDRAAPTLPARMPLAELADRLGRHDPTLGAYQGFCLVDEEKRLVGVITRGDVVRALERGVPGETTVLEAGNDELLLGYPDQALSEAVELMAMRDIGRLPVVERRNPQALIGYLGRSAILEARERRRHEESVTEPGWFGRPRR